MSIELEVIIEFAYSTGGSKPTKKSNIGTSATLAILFTAAQATDAQEKE